MSSWNVAEALHEGSGCDRGNKWLQAQKQLEEQQREVERLKQANIDVAGASFGTRLKLYLRRKNVFSSNRVPGVL